ncbi:MAG: lamin tail domain-containing protein [Flavobacteriales bacterium]|nr:lamin tail domain-containing protein [Flavobacteriales bacterium]
MRTSIHGIALRCLLATALLLPTAVTRAQALLTGSSYTQNFNAMGSSGTAALPAGFRIGTEWGAGTTATTQAAGTSGTGVLTGSNSGGAYNFANGVTASSTERAVGFLNSGSYTTPRSIILRIDNNTGATVTALTVAFDYEKYRSGSRAWTWNFFHGGTSTASTAATAGDESYAADANNTVIFNPPTAVSKSVSLTGLAIPNGGSYYLRWALTGNGGSSNGQALGIDNVSITVPPPTLPAPVATFAQHTAGIAVPPLVAGSTGQVQLGFTATTNASASTSPATQALTGLVVQTSSNTNGTLSTVRLVASVDADPTTTGDNTVLGTFTQNAGNLQLTGLSRALSATAQYFFLLADVSSGVTPATPALSLTQTQAGTTLSGGNKNTFSFTGGPFAFTGSGAPMLAATDMDAFGAVCVNAVLPPVGTFVLTGTDLTAGDVVVGPLNGFAFYDANTFDYVPTLTLVHNGSLAYEVSVRFLPTAQVSYAGSIPVAGGGASTSVAVSGTGIDTPPVAVTGTATNIGQHTVQLGGTLASAGCTDPTGVGIVLSTTNGFVPATGTTVPAAAVGDQWSVDVSALDPCTTYYFRAFATNSGGTHYGAQGSFATLAPPAPAVQVASAIFSTGFTAHWDAVVDATGYRVDVSAQPTFAVEEVAADLFISEYAEGTGSNKYIELYNGTGAAVNLASYSLRLYSNGSSTVSQQLVLSGTLASGATLVYKNGSAVWSGTAITNNTVINFNGDDAVALAKSGVNIDVVGTIGQATVFGQDVTLVRKATIAQGSTTFSTAQWDTYPVNTESTLGGHVSNVPNATPSFVPGFADVLVNTNTLPVTGLVLGQTYYYRVRALLGACTSMNSATQAVTTVCDSIHIADVVSTSPVCSTDTLALQVTIASGEGIYTYAWQGGGTFLPGANTAAVNVAGPQDGTYTVVVSNGCSSEQGSTAVSLAPDSDADGLCDELDGCPNDADKTEPGACGCGVADVDGDNDGVADCIDNCAAVANAGQEDADADGAGDGCDVCPNDADNDVDEDGFCADVDPCPALFGVPGDACDASVAPGFQPGTISAGCQCVPVTCTENVTVELRTGVNSEEVSWRIVSANGEAVACQGGGFPSGITTPITENCCLPAGCYRLVVNDSGGDGFVNGGYQLRESGANGRRIIDNTGNFASGAESALAVNYDNGTFCVPIGTDRPIFSSCDKLDWVNDQFIVATENTAVSAQYGTSNTTSGYEFWFFDPNGSYSFRRFRSHATTDGSGAGALRANHFRINAWTNTSATPHLPANVLLNVRIRGRVNGGNLPFGAACLFKLDAVRAACPLVKLQDNPLNTADHSCGVSRVFGGANSSANKVVANPPQFVGVVPAVASASVRYQFRFRLPGEHPAAGSCIVRPAQTSPTLYLNWTSGDKLKCNTQYQVDVRVSKDGGATWCVAQGEATCGAAPTAWGKVCSVNITSSTYCPNTAQGAADQLAHGVPTATATRGLVLWPNPNTGDALYISSGALEQQDGNATVTVHDLQGQVVLTHLLPVHQGMVQGRVPLEALATGLYLVSVHSGAQRFTERVTIAR